ncbi:uncharacterized protein LOC124452015 [Xenia sp. Carnegie-2017]|uniref:uncharacterized protein LOC124452015 n=1 Tax=Xenia sp. Carnegie-2017 TaxID=2897299 RepID=UPI001F04C0F0|nr:uncharacterized protein LOC124452015 [Xenia sp. Carnegie-2017]
MPNESFSSAAALAQTLNKANSLLLHTSSQELLPGIPTSGDMQPAVLTHNFDVSLYREKVKGMDNSEICHLIKNVYKPDKKYHFPKSNGRSFRHDWLDQHEWLCYSPSQNGTLQPIEMIMDAGIKKEIEQNREILSPIIDSVIFCGRLGLPLRGHRDDSKYHPTVGCYSSGGVGNFIETLNYGVRRGDKVLENHLKNCGKNRSYISKTSQNKIIKCCGQVISNQIISDIKKFDFVVALVITRNILDSTLPVTQLLQGKSIDIMDGIHLISTLKTEVVNMRNSSDFYHDTWYDEALELAAKVGIEEWKPRTVRKQTTRENIPTQPFLSIINVQLLFLY